MSREHEEQERETIQLAQAINNLVAEGTTHDVQINGLMLALLMFADAHDISPRKLTEAFVTYLGFNAKSGVAGEVINGLISALERLRSELQDPVADTMLNLIARGAAETAKRHLDARPGLTAKERADLMNIVKLGDNGL